MIRGKKNKIRKATRKQQAKAAELFTLAAATIMKSDVRQILYKAKWGMRLPYAYVVWRVGRMCRHRNVTRLHGKRVLGPICGDVWELATFGLETYKLLNVKCYMHGHVKPRKAEVTHELRPTGC